MRKEVLTSVCALALVFGASSAFAGAYGEPVEAEEAPVPAPPPPAVVEEVAPIDYARTGPYLGVGTLYAVELFDDAVANTGVRTDNSWGFHLKGGWRLHPNLALELRYDWMHEFDLDPGFIDAWLLTGNVKGYILTGRFQPYALVGMGYLAANGSGGNNPGAAHVGDDFALRFGAGMDAYVTEHIVLGPEIAYVLPTGDAQDLDMLTVSLGAAYRF